MSTTTPAEQRSRKMTPRSMVIWTIVALVGGVSWAVLALSRGEEISALWILCAALGSYAIAYRFYSRFIAYRALGVDDTYRSVVPQASLNNGAIPIFNPFTVFAEICQS